MAPVKRRKIGKRRNTKCRPSIRAPISRKTDKFVIGEEAHVEGFQFLSLPGEIRKLVYRHILVSDQPVQIPRKKAFDDFERSQLVCKQVRSEVRPIFNRENCFHWCDGLVGRQWDLFLRGPIAHLQSLMISITSIDWIFTRLSHAHNFVIWVAASDYRLLRGGPGRLSLRQLSFHIQRPYLGREYPERPPPGSEDFAATDMVATPFSSKRTEYGNFPRMKSVRSIRVDTIKPVHPLWIDKIRRGSGCVVEVGTYS